MADYTDDVTSGMTFSASSEYSADYNASKAFDDLANYWITASGQSSSNQWIKVDFGIGNSKQIEKITIKNRYLKGFNSFIFQGSTDDSNWDNLYSGTASSSVSIISFTFSNSNGYRYYRVYCSSGHNPTTLRVTEIEMMERKYFPLTIALSESLEYGITLSESLEYGITLSESLEYGITLSETGGG